MPLNIKNTRATVSQEFLNAMYDTMRGVYKKRKEEIEYAYRGQKDILKERYKVPMTKIAVIFKDPTQRDLYITKLRSLPFECFTYEEVAGRKYMVGLTRPITMDCTDKTHWNIGQYTIYVPTSMRPNEIHMVPIWDPYAHARFPHHTANWSKREMIDKVYEDVRIPKTHPTNGDPNTCWGGFGGMVGSIVNEGDVVELFRTLQTYLTRCDTKSLLTGMFWQNAGDNAHQVKA